MSGTVTSLSTDLRAKVNRLEAANPEWVPLLRMVGQTLAALENRLGDRMLRRVARDEPGAEGPALHGSVLVLDRVALSDWVGRFPPLAALAADQARSSLQDGIRETIIEEAGTSPLRVAARLAIPPVLEAASRRAGEVAVPWGTGFCPTCGGWPVMAESRGLEQRRMLRCGRCGGDWEHERLRCTFCGERDHQRLASLVAERGSSRVKVETCASCRGYLKTLPTLLPLSLSELLMLDLETIELDLAAGQAGFQRPAGLGFPLEIRVELG